MTTKVQTDYRNVPLANLNDSAKIRAAPLSPPRSWPVSIAFSFVSLNCSMHERLMERIFVCFVKTYKVIEMNQGVILRQAGFRRMPIQHLPIVQRMRNRFVVPFPRVHFSHTYDNSPSRWFRRSAA